MTNQPIIQVENLHKHFGELKVLQGITEEIYPGEVVVIIGPSGSGKSTFLRCLNLLETPDSGEIYFDGHHITDKTLSRSKREKAVDGYYIGYNQYNSRSMMHIRSVSQNEVRMSQLYNSGYQTDYKLVRITPEEFYSVYTDTTENNSGSGENHPIDNTF